MESNKPTLASLTRSWFNLSLFNSRRAGDYFEYLLQGIDPMWSATECRARVLEVRDETADTKTFVLRPNATWKGFQAGQHLHISMEINGARQTRTFTISSLPQEWEQQGFITLTVKKVPDGRVTPWMHEHLLPGTVVSISQAGGDFVLPTDLNESLAFIAAGSGITPIASMLRSLVARNMPVPSSLLYFARTDQDFIFGDTLQGLSRAMSRFSLHLIAADGGSKKKGRSTLPQGFISAEHVRAVLTGEPKTIYVCGPHPFRELAKQLLAEQGFPLNQIREEAFGLPPLPRTEGAPVTVSFSRSHTSTTTDQPGTLLEMAEQSGLKPTSGCRMGICYTCKCTKKSGQVRNVITGEISSNDEEDIQICVTTPVSNVELAI
ncbi:MAG TPA: ferredoxin reductase [Candidatus Kapabacteria bacterium]|nr:ferredoxin reductase [Candidatus Kapabacteria bacterium]